MEKIIKSFDISYSEIFEIYMDTMYYNGLQWTITMDTQMLEAINFIRNVSKKKVTIDKIVTYLINAGASNWDKLERNANKGHY